MLFGVLIAQFVLELLAMLASLFCYGSLKKHGLGWLVVFLVSTCIAECGTFILRLLHSHSNVFYVFYYYLELFSWGMIYYSLFRTEKLKAIVTITVILLAVAGLIEMIAHTGLNDINLESRSAACIIFILLGALYIYQNLEKPYHDFMEDPFFFLGAGSIIFNGFFFLNLNIMKDNGYYFVKNSLFIFELIQFTANLIFYPSLIWATLLCYFRQRAKQVHFYRV